MRCRRGPRQGRKSLLIPAGWALLTQDGPCNRRAEHQAQRHIRHDHQYNLQHWPNGRSAGYACCGPGGARRGGWLQHSHIRRRHITHRQTSFAHGEVCRASRVEAQDGAQRFDGQPRPKTPENGCFSGCGSFFRQTRVQRVVCCAPLRGFLGTRSPLRVLRASYCMHMRHVAGQHLICRRAVLCPSPLPAAIATGKA